MQQDYTSTQDYSQGDNPPASSPFAPPPTVQQSRTSPASLKLPSAAELLKAAIQQRDDAQQRNTWLIQNRGAFYAQLQADQPQTRDLSTGQMDVQQLMPQDLETSYKNALAKAESELAKASTNLTNLYNKQSPVAQQQAALNIAQKQIQTDVADMQRQQMQNPDHPGMTDTQANAQNVKMAELALQQHRTSLDRGEYLNNDALKRYELTSKTLADQMQAAHNSLYLSQQKDEAALRSVDAQWKSVYEQAGKEWAKDYEEQVSQRGQDITAAHAMASEMGAMAGKVLPYIAPSDQLASYYKSIGHDPALAYSHPAPSYSDVAHWPQQAYTQMMGQPGLPAWVQPGPSPDASGAPNPWDILGHSTSPIAQQAMDQWLQGGNNIPLPPQAQLPQAPALPPTPAPTEYSQNPMVAPITGLSPEEAAAYWGMNQGYTMPPAAE